MKMPALIMSGSGNTFVVMDNRKGCVKGSPSEFAERVCRREKTDGLLLVEEAERPNAHAFKMHFFNPDGSEPGMCGNGARCIAWFAVKELEFNPHGLVFGVVNGDGVVHADVDLGNGLVAISGMIDPNDYRLRMPIDPGRLGLPPETEISFINSGVPHAVVWVSDLAEVDVATVGRRIRSHKEFGPAGTNVNFATVLGRNRLSIRTYERGVERETGACGTGAIAAAVVAAYEGRVDSKQGEIIYKVDVLAQSGAMLEIGFSCNGDEPKKHATRVGLKGKVELLGRKEISC